MIASTFIFTQNQWPLANYQGRTAWSWGGKHKLHLFPQLITTVVQCKTLHQIQWIINQVGCFLIDNVQYLACYWRCTYSSKWIPFYHMLNLVPMIERFWGVRKWFAYHDISSFLVIWQIHCLRNQSGEPLLLPTLAPIRANISFLW